MLFLLQSRASGLARRSGVSLGDPKAAARAANAVALQMIYVHFQPTMVGTENIYVQMLGRKEENVGYGEAGEMKGKEEIREGREGGKGRERGGEGSEKEGERGNGKKKRQ